MKDIQSSPSHSCPSHDDQILSPILVMQVRKLPEGSSNAIALDRIFRKPSDNDGGLSLVGIPPVAVILAPLLIHNCCPNNCYLAVTPAVWDS